MPRILKALGLALVAVLAMSAMVASAASAATKFTASGGKGTTITAIDNGKVQLKVTGTTITCETHYEGEAPGTSFPEIKVEAEYGHCTSGLGISATVSGFGQHSEATPCTFNLQSDGKADLNCPAGQEVTVKWASCTVYIPAQQNVGTLTYTNNGSKLNIAFNITSITANHTDHLFCPLTSSGWASSAELVTPAGEPLLASASVGAFNWDAS